MRTAKLTIALILGMIFQVAHVVPAASFTDPCGMAQGSCDCCAGPSTCHCADNGDSDQSPAPVPLDAGSLLKIPVAKPVETTVSIHGRHQSDAATAIVCVARSEPVSGYTGTSLSVAFCSFLI